MFLRISIQAFYTNEATATALMVMSEDRQLLRASVDVQPGGIQQACTVLANQTAPNLLIIETQETGVALTESLNTLAEVCVPGTQVILVGVENDILLYRKILDMGIQEYLPAPVSAEQLLATIDRLFTATEGSSDCRVVAFMGARGGAGSSTIAVNTAYSLAHHFKEEVVLLDLDLAFGTAALALNMQPSQNIAEALLQSGRLDEVMLERFLSHHDEYLSVIAAPGHLDTTSQIDLGGFEVLMGVLSRRAAFIVLDVPHQWPPWVTDILVAADEVVITGTPDLTSLKTVKNLFDRLAPKRGVDAPIRVVMNHVGASRKTELSPDDFENAVAVKPTALIAHNAFLFGASMNNGELIAQASKKSAPAQQFEHLSSVVCGRIPVVPTRKWFSLLRRKIV